MPWQLIHQDVQSATMVYRHAEGEHGWPWAFRAEQDVMLDSSGVTLRLRITNESAVAMPCGCGFHPYFPGHFGHRLQFRAGSVWPPTADFLAVMPMEVESQHDYAAPRPLPREAVLLADPRLVLEPDLDLLLARHPRKVGSERAREVFLNAWMTSPSCLG